MNTIPRILIAEDEPKVAKLLGDYIVANNWECEHVTCGDAVIPMLKQNNFNVLLLDIRLPVLDGLSLLKMIRADPTVFKGLGIIIISAQVEEIDRLLGLELGADDYICKPFSPREVMARVKALLRRHLSQQAEEVDAQTNSTLNSAETVSTSAVPQLSLDANRLSAQLNAQVLDLTVVEFRLLQTLYQRPGRVLSRQQLMDQLYDDNRIVSDRTIDSHVKKLRRKLEGANPHWSLIDSVYGVGFRFDPKLVDKASNKWEHNHD